MKPIPQVTGIAWYRREEYPALLALFEDAANLPETYEDWLVRAEKGFQNLEREGFTVVRVEIDLAEFTHWCRAGAHKFNSEARRGFVNHQLALRYRRSN